MAGTQQELNKIEKAVVKLRNKMKRADLDYTVQISRSSVEPTVTHYSAQITAPANGLAPVTFIHDSAEELIEALKASTKKIDYEAIEVAFHEAQIKACKNTILGHEERIQEIKDGDGEESSSETNNSEEEDS